MTDEDLCARDQFSTYRLANCWSLRRAGLKGWWVEAKIVGDDAPALILTGTRRGRAEIPLANIRRIRAGVDQGKTRRLDSYRCLLWLDGEQEKLVLRPMSAGKLIYGDLVLHLAEEMKRIGHFDRVERGLQRWENALYSVLWVVAAVFLTFVAYDTLKPSFGAMEAKEIVFACITLGFCACLLVGSVAMWGDASRPRPARSLKDLMEVLP